MHLKITCARDFGNVTTQRQSPGGQSSPNDLFSKSFAWIILGLSLHLFYIYNKLISSLNIYFANQRIQETNQAMGTRFKSENNNKKKTKKHYIYFREILIPLVCGWFTITAKEKGKEGIAIYVGRSNDWECPWMSPWPWRECSLLLPPPHHSVWAISYYSTSVLICQFMSQNEFSCMSVWMLF